MEQLHTVGTIFCKEISFSNIAFVAIQYHSGNELIHTIQQSQNRSGKPWQHNLAVPQTP